VNVNNADSFRLAGSLVSRAGPQLLLENDIKDMPLFEVGVAGIPILRRASIKQKP
jgi:hypothetical protein